MADVIGGALADDFDLSRSMIRARDTRGKGLLAQVREIARLAFSRRRLSAYEYYRYGLFDDARYDPEAKSRFLGEACHVPLIRATCDLRWWAVADDKVVTYTMLKAFGAPIPTTVALVHPYRIFPDAKTLKDADALATFLRTEAVYPLFSKPVSGVRSLSVSLLAGYDADTDAVAMHDGSARRVDDFARELASTEGQTRGDGVLLQEVMQHHRELERLAGPAISSVRVLVTVEAEGPRVIGAMWKIIGGEQIADNAWRPGNLLASLDHRTGAVTRVVKADGTDVEEVSHHPTTSEKLLGVTLPHWDDVTALCTRYAALSPKVRFQGWDVAICDDGPRLVEANTGSSFMLTQLASGRGIADEDFERFVAWAASINETPPRGVQAYLQRV
ncbi:MAG: sugar-transfer associated ATP-grasp domain-containing protein [Myxococcota bacterium]